MRVGFLTLEYPPARSGGIGTSIRNLARALVHRGHRVTVMGWGEPARFDDDGVSVRVHDYRSPPRTGWLVNRLLMQREMRRMVKEEGLEIVEAHDWCGPSAGIHPGCPVVVRCHGSAVFFGDVLHEPVRWSVRLAERLALTGADGVAAVSRFAAGRTAALFGIERPIAVLGNGVDVSQFRAAVDAEIDERSLAYVGTIVRKKGVLDLCRAFSKLVAQMPDARLLVVGRDAPDKSTGSASTWALCLRELSAPALDRVQYVGAQPHDSIQALVRRAAVCVFPSYAEALPVAWLEAMACGKPIVAYDVGWARELVVDGRTGWLAPAGNVDLLCAAVARVLRDPAARRRLGAAARDAVEADFTNDICAARTVEWYHQVLGGRQ